MRLSLCFGLVLALLPIHSAHAIKIGYINLREALNNVYDGKQAKAKLKQKKAQYQKLLNKEQRALKRAKKMYERRLAILRGPAKRREQVKLQKKFFKLQKKYTALTRQLARAEALETRRIFRKMEVVIRSIAKDYSLTLMLEKTESSILYATKDMDYTSELIRRYNKLYEGKGKKRRRRKRRRRRRKR